MTHHINQPLENSEGGFIESVKRTIVSSLRKALTNSATSLSDDTLTIDIDYPYEKANYPCIWVQFSFSNLQDQGVGHQERIEHEGRNAILKQWMYEGTVTVTVIALSSLERDRIADKFISIFAFANIPGSESIYDDPEYNFLQELSESEYVSMTLSSGKLHPGGQTAIPGTPFDHNQMTYEDTYSFDLQGEFQTVYTPGEGYRLRRIDIKAVHNIFTKNSVLPGTWV